MPEQPWMMFGVAVVLFIITVLWVLSFVYVSVDVSRRYIPRLDKILWVVIVFLLPIAGLVLYLLGRSLGISFSSGDQNQGKYKKRFTMPMVPLRSEKKMPTIPMDYLVNKSAREAQSIGRSGADQRVAAPTYTFAVIEGPNAGDEFVLTRLPAKLGRGIDAAIRLDDRNASRQHAEIYEHGGILRIRDLKSTHGTYVNGFSIDDKSLDPGDKIRIGSSVLHFRVR